MSSETIAIAIRTSGISIQLTGMYFLQKNVNEIMKTNMIYFENYLKQFILLKQFNCAISYKQLATLFNALYV